MTDRGRQTIAPRKLSVFLSATRSDRSTTLEYAMEIVDGR